MESGTKIQIGVGFGVLAALAAFFVPKLLKLKNAATNLIIDVLFERVHSVREGVVKLFFTSNIRNLSGFDVLIENLSVILEASTDGGKSWDNLGSSPERILRVTALDNKTTTIHIPVELKLASLLTAMLSPKNKYRVTVNYDYSGMPLQYVKIMDTTLITKQIGNSVKKILGLSGIEAPQTTLLGQLL